MFTIFIKDAKQEDVAISEWIASRNQYVYL